MSKNLQIVAWIVFVALVGGAIFYALSGNTGNDNPASAASSAADSEPQMVEILKYSDYSCPACKQYIPFQEQLKRDFGENITIEYRHFPLSGFQYSNLAARAVEAAAEQGQKEQMHDRIFDEQSTWTQGNAEEYFLTYAEEIGLDLDQFRQDLDASHIRERVERQRSEGERRMVQGTPTYFINGQRVRQLPQNYGQFRSLVEMYMYR